MIQQSILTQKQTHADLDTPILVVGYMHSGTTLLQQIFGRHPDVLITGGETSFFVNFSTTVEKFPDLHEDRILYDYVEYLMKVICATYTKVNYTDSKAFEPVRLEDFDITPSDVDELFQIAQSNRSHRALYPIAFDFMTRKRNKRRWFDKLAGYVSQLDEMLAVVPNAQVIELVRDPRDILASKKRRAKDGWSYDPIWDSLAWMAAVRAGNVAQQNHPAQIIRVRYEDLVYDPEAAVKRICRFLNLQFDEDMLSVGWINSTTAEMVGNNAQISTAPVGKWVHQLPAADALVCQKIVNREMQQNGYAAESYKTKTYLMLPLLVIRSSIEFFYRLYTKWRLGGFSHVRSVFVNYRGRLQSLMRS